MLNRYSRNLPFEEVFSELAECDAWKHAVIDVGLGNNLGKAIDEKRMDVNRLYPDRMLLLRSGAHGFATALREIRRNTLYGIAKKLLESFPPDAHFYCPVLRNNFKVAILHMRFLLLLLPLYHDIELFFENPTRLLADNLPLVPRDFFSVFRHYPFLRSLSGDNHGIARACRVERTAYCFATVKDHFRPDALGNARSDLSHNHGWIFVIRIFVCQNNGIAELRCNAPEFRPFPPIAPSARRPKNANKFYIFCFDSGVFQKLINTS